MHLEKYMNNKKYSIREYNFVAKNQNRNSYYDSDGNLFLKPESFEELNNFIRSNTPLEGDSPDTFLTPSFRKGIGDVLKAKNYVGVIQTLSGTSLEILPKIYGSLSIEETKIIFMKMLRTLKDVSFISSSMADINIESMHIFDIFIQMFLNELNLLVKKGIKSSYLQNTRTLKKIKGKINFPKNIKHNLFHREKFYCEYEEYNINRPENRIIKRTLYFLKKVCSLSKLDKEIYKFLFIFDEIEPSKNIDSDFKKCKNNRLVSHYKKILNWCNIFLKNKSFTNFHGNELTFALLFPMEKIFESYFANLMKRKFINKNLFVQKKIGSLLSNGNYSMVPDLIVKEENSSFIFDTKWKIIKDKISQADLYQMFAYGTKYDRIIDNTKKIFLIYPQNEDFTNIEKHRFYDLENKKLELYLLPFDLTNEHLSLKKIKEEI